MKKLSILLILTAAGCGGHYDAKVGGDVYVHHQIEVTDLRRYFLAECEADDPSGSQEEHEECADAKLGKALSFMFGDT